MRQPAGVASGLKFHRNIIGGAAREAMRCGQIVVNGYGAGGGVELSLGVVGRSGHGREKGLEAMYAFSASKTIMLNH